LFSSLVSQDNAMQNALMAQIQGTPQASAVTASNIPAAPSSSSAASFPASSDSSGLSIQSVDDLTRVLRTVLSILRQRVSVHSGASSSQHIASSPAQAHTTAAGGQKKEQSQTAASPEQDASAGAAASGQDGNASNALITGASSSSSAQNVTDSATAVDDAGTSGSSPDALQTLSDIVAELLLLMQLVLLKLQQDHVKAAGSDITLAIETTKSATDVGANIVDTAQNQTQASTAADQALDEICALLSAAAEKAATPASADAQASLTAATGDHAQTADPLIQLLQAMEKSVRQLLTASTASSAQNPGLTSGVQAGSDGAPSASEMITQLVQVEDDLKNALAALQLQNNPTPKIADSATKPSSESSDETDAPTARILSNAPAVVDASQIRASTASVTVTQQATQTTADSVQPNQAPAIAALVAGATSDARYRGDSNAGTDLMSGGDHYAPSASIPGITGSGLTAEGSQASGIYSFASTLSAFRALNGGSAGLPSVVDQVILQMNRSVKSGNDQLSVQLQPGDLGKITVKLDIGSDGKVQGTVTADNPQTLNMLQKDSRSLERALQDAGLRPDPGSLQFSLSGQGNQNNAGQTASGGSNKDNTGADGTITAGDTADAGIVDIGAIADTYYLTPTGVNIRV
jgi:hypothetical protein